ncbi:hypothetical protein [Neorhizobium sp. LjRoot104]|uniref:hypothetical protein n=1 Tax=Neorhizobium sp. LjRoot104 TaxID=3342254 RepID=UPI003ECF4DEC
MATTIEDLPPTAIPSREHVVPAMKDGITVGITVAQMMGLIDPDDVTTGIAAATSDNTFADTDQFVYLDGGVLKIGTFSGLISSLFATGRTISNAQFAAASFKLFNAAGTPRALQIVTTALTADRTATMPDRNVNLGNVPLSGRFKSSQQTVTLGGSLTIPHGLGATPDISSIYASVVNTSGGTANGYAAGIELRTKTDNVGTVSGAGIEVWADATNIYARIGNAALATTVNGGTGAGNESFSVANWKVCLGCQL